MINLGKFKILENHITACDYEYILHEIIQAITHRTKLLISPIASQTLVLAKDNAELKNSLEKFDYLVPDSQWVKRSINWLYGIHLKERVYGPDLMLKTCALAEKQHWRIYLYGTNHQTLSKLKSKLLSLYPKLKIVQAKPSPYRDMTKEELGKLRNSIHKSGAQIIFIAIGSPKQEVLTTQLTAQGEMDQVFIPVGAAFDFISGVKKQAPKWMGNTGLEWLFRLIQEPRRLWRRYICFGIRYLPELIKNFAQLIQHFLIKAVLKNRGLIICLACGLIYIIPQYVFRYPSLIDVAETFSLPGRHSNLGIVIDSIFSDTLRFRPAYTLQRIVLNTLFNYHLRCYFIFNGILLGLILYVMVMIIKPKNTLYFVSLLLLMLISPITVDNFWRLGTAEGLFTLLLLIAIYSIIRNRSTWLLITIGLFILTKETSVFFLPVFIYISYRGQKFQIMIFQMILLEVLILLLLPKISHINRISYTSLFKVDLTSNSLLFLDYIKTYPVVFLYPFFGVILMVINNSFRKLKIHTNKPDVNTNYLILFLIASLFAPLIFINIQAYYLFPSLALSIIILVHALQQQNTFFNNIILIITLVLILSESNIHSLKERASYWHLDYSDDQPLVTFLLSNKFRFYIDRDSNRIDHVDALERILRHNIVLLPSKADYIITRNNETLSNSKTQKILYNKTIFMDKPHCRWFLIKVNL